MSKKTTKPAEDTSVPHFVEWEETKYKGPDYVLTVSHGNASGTLEVKDGKLRTAMHGLDIRQSPNGASPMFNWMTAVQNALGGGKPKEVKKFLVDHGFTVKVHFAELFVEEEPKVTDGEPAEVTIEMEGENVSVSA